MRFNLNLNRSKEAPASATRFFHNSHRSRIKRCWVPPSRGRADDGSQSTNPMGEPLKMALDILGIKVYISATSLMRGVKPVTPIDGAGCGALRARLRQPCSREASGPRPAGTRTGVRGAR